MAWIESHQTLGQHPKTKRLARYLEVSLPAAVGHLHYLWWWALDYAQDGDLSRYEPEDIADAVLWDGDAKAFVEALIRAGFLDQVNDKLLIHDWDDYAGRLIDKRKANSERARRWREKKSNECATNAFVTHNECATNGATVPNHTVPNHTEPGVNNLLTCASPDDDARAGNGQSPAVNNPVDDVEAVKVTVQPDEQSTNKAGQDPGGSVEAEMVTATPGEQQVKTPLENEGAGEKLNKPRPPFTSKKQEQLFDQFWQLYPRKKNKGQAERVWAKLRPNDELFASIMAGLERAKASYDWQKEGGKYIPYPATWLNAKGWEDEYTPVEEVNRANGTYRQSFIKPGATKSLDEARRNRFAALYQNTES